MWSKWFVQRQEKSCLKEYSHLIQLFIDLLIILIVFTKLGDQGPISQCEQLRVLKNKQTKNQQKPHRSHVMFATHKSGQMTTFLPARKAYIKNFKLNNNLGMGYFWTSRSQTDRPRAAPRIELTFDASLGLNNVSLICGTFFYCWSFSFHTKL